MKPRPSLVLAGFCSLFLELALIRWLPANVLSLAYFSNLVLLSSFVGLGIGFLLPPAQHDRFRHFPLVLLAVVGISLLLRYVQPIVPNLPNELIWSVYTDNSLRHTRVTIGILPTLALVFVLNALPFILLGDKIGALMRRFRPLEAYALEISGSLLGIIAFTGLAFLGPPLATPAIWCLCVGAASLFLIQDTRLHLGIGVAAVIGTVGMTWHATSGQIWSPYYRMDIVRDTRTTGSLDVFVNQFFFQKMIDFDTNPRARSKYEYPYTLLKPASVLVLGAGSGNDVAIAIRHGVPHIDAVELDRAIVEAGRALHANRPYDDPRVHVMIDDARSFLAKASRDYDLIVLGTLDSHALLSARSTVRLDNFVYTQEALRSVKEHLGEDGVAVLMFSVPAQWLGDKLVKSVQAAFGSEHVIALEGDAYLFSLMVFAGPGVDGILREQGGRLSAPKEVADALVPKRSIPTDDWPYLYLKERGISPYYLQAIGVLLCAALVTLAALLRNQRAKLFRPESGVFFFLGTGFLVLETKSITTLSLLFGSTWIVNAFVFGSILAVVLLANIIVSKVAVSRTALYVCLGCAIVLNFLVPVSNVLHVTFLGKALLGSFLVAIPLLFASMIFSMHFKKVSDIRLMFGVNLMGAVTGGFLEYVAMLVGLNALYLLALGVYALAFGCYRLTGDA